MRLFPSPPGLAVPPTRILTLDRTRSKSLPWSGLDEKVALSGICEYFSAQGGSGWIR